MTIHGLNAWGVVIGVLVTFISGGIWFGPKTFYPIWFKAKGLTPPTPGSGPNPAILFGTTIVTVIIQVLVLGAIITVMN